MVAVGLGSLVIDKLPRRTVFLACAAVYSAVTYLFATFSYLMRNKKVGRSL